MGIRKSAGPRMRGSRRLPHGLPECCGVRNLRIAMLNRPPAAQGGDHIAFRYTVAALAKLGVDAFPIWGEQLRCLAGFDLAHCFHLDFDWAIENYAAALAWKLPYVCTPI